MWDGIIKVHSHIHVTRDIRTKGALSNMDTKPGERLNGPIRKAYLLQTNFKEVEKQVGGHLPLSRAKNLMIAHLQLARLEDYAMTSCVIQANIDSRDSYLQACQETDDAAEGGSKTQFGHVYLGSPCQPALLASFISDNDDQAFAQFHRKLSVCIDDLVARENQPEGQRGNSIYTGPNVVSATTSIPEYESHYVYRSQSIATSRCITTHYQLGNRSQTDSDAHLISMASPVMMQSL